MALGSVSLGFPKAQRAPGNPGLASCHDLFLYLKGQGTY